MEPIASVFFVFFERGGKSMNLSRWESGQDVQNIRSQFENLFRNFDRMIGGQTRSETLMPPVDVYINGNEVVIQCDLPGLEQRDVDVITTRDSITINGEFKRREDLKEEHCVECERCFGKFSRTIILPEAIDFDKTKATFKNGLLTITAPLVEGAKRRPHRITIEA
jgi:HSP20 family protein